MLKSSDPPILTLARIRPRPDPFLLVCRCISILTAMVAIVCIFINVIAAFRSFKKGSDVFGGIFRCYAVAFALFVAIAETEWSFITTFWRILDYWAGRGMLQIFVAVMTRAFPDNDTQREELVLIQEIASYLLIACGVIHVFFGVMCLGFLKRAREHKEVSRKQASIYIEEIERRREDLEARLLADKDLKARKVLP